MEMNENMYISFLLDFTDFKQEYKIKCCMFKDLCKPKA